MNDEILAQQLAATGNLMDLLNNETWLRETAAIEAGCCGWVEAGLGLQPYVEQLETLPPEALRRQRRQVQVLSILLPALKGWLQSWGLGLSMEAVYIEAQRRLYEHLQQLTLEQTTRIEALLAEAAQPPASDRKTIRSEAVAMLSQMFTEDDWQAFAQTAAEGMAKGVLQVRQLEAVVS
jgi:hypothetical protein